ncbi:MAG: type III-A CRISPR-associated RAMP protein Csm3 [Nitrosospira sp.]
MQLTQIKQITSTLVLKTGLHIGGGDTEMRIGGIDNQVVKNPVSGLPYIPGSSLKGKIRSLLEWKHGLVSLENNGKPFSFQQLKDSEIDAAAGNLLRLFGGAPDKNLDDKIKKIGTTRLLFWDCALNAEWKKSVLDERNLLVTEAKSENSINRISGVADNPRFTERVIAGAGFDFRLTLKVHDDEDLLDMVLTGLKLLEYDSLGGSGSRGYGKIEFRDLRVDDVLVQDFERLRPFNRVA